MVGAEQGFWGTGLGLRRGLLRQLLDLDDSPIDFVELAPENWIRIGGKLCNQLREIAERYPVVCHGLSLSIGSPAPLDLELIERIRVFLREYGVLYYTEHLSYCSDDRGHLYDLMPIPFTEEAAVYVARRIRQVQDLLGQQIAMENVSYYETPGQELDEVDFINYVARESDCDILLDVNNVYVNSINFGYDARTFLESIDSDRVKYMHIAGHYKESESLLVDTHGSDVCDPVWELLYLAYQICGVRPTLLERDFNYPSMDSLLSELNRMKVIQGPRD